jgi:fructose-bisphosphate aldolase, class II
MTIHELLFEAYKNKKAIGHFNIATLEMLHGIIEAAKVQNVGVLIGTSENEADFIGRKQTVALIQAVREETGLPIFLNADHHKSVEAAKRAIDAGYDSVHIDLSKEPYEKNLAGTKEVVQYARTSGRDISVEGELGYLPTDSSKTFDEAVEINPDDFTKSEQAKEFIEQTGINRFAPAVGNFHGMSTKTEKHLDFARIAEIRATMPQELAMVLHGGSGTSVDQVSQAIKTGMNNVHISTELRVAYTSSLRKALADMSDETTPYKLLPPVIEAVKAIVIEKLTLFNK